MTLAAALAAGVFATGAAAQQQVEIRALLNPALFTNEYLAWFENEWLPVLEEEHPHISVHITPLSGNRLDAVAVSIAGGVPYDIVDAAHTLPMIEGVGNDWYLPLDRFIAEWDDAEYVIPSVWAHTEWEGSIYALPNHLPPRLIAFNKHHFRESGLDPDRPPSSWDEMLEHARRLLRAEGDRLERRGYHMLTGNGDVAVDFELYASNNGAQILSQDYRSPRFHELPGLEALRFMRELYALNNPAGFTSTLDTSANRGFYNGETSMIRVAGAGVARNVAANYADTVEMGLFLPRSRPDQRPATTSSINSLAILRFTEHPEEAWAVLAHLNRRESLEMIAMLRGQLIPRTDVIPFIADNLPEMVPYYEFLDYLVPRPKWPSGAGYTYTTGLGEPARSALMGEVSPEAALEEAHRRVQLLLDAFWAEADR